MYLMIIIPWSSFLALSLRGWDPLKVLMEPCCSVWSVWHYMELTAYLAWVPFWRVVLIGSFPISLDVERVDRASISNKTYHHTVS